MKENIELFLSVLQTLGIIIGAVWAWYRFRVEKPTHPRIEFDVEAQFLGPQANSYLATFTIIAANKGNVEHKFRRIEIEILGLRQEEALVTLNDKQQRIQFPVEFVKLENLIPEKMKYYFVRPNVHQKIHYYTAIPDNIRFVRVFLSFRYEKSKDTHTAERIFEINPTKGNHPAN